jgi:hypothetical protein
MPANARTYYTQFFGGNQPNSSGAWPLKDPLAGKGKAVADLAWI